MILKELRLLKGMTQQDVADAIGCTAVVYSRYERGTREPSIEVFLRLADTFGVTVDYLLGRQTEECSSLSGNEIELVIAAREADPRAVADALTLLRTHSKNLNKKGTPE